MKFIYILLTVLLALSAEAQQVPRRRALLIGIDDYTASALPHQSQAVPSEERWWPDLKGAANDVGILRDVLVLVYGFDSRDIITLKNQQATRTAILQSIEQHLVMPARKGDIVFYYFAGHGSQVPNLASDELDQLDESMVPADSRWGADDIRDKQLRPLFNRILDRGAYLTLVLDHCHSGSSFRGLPNGARPRGIRRARAILDAKHYGPRPDERGALVLASTQDLDQAWEKRGDDGLMHGSFTWAWIRALRDAAAGEAAQETFLRAQARMRAETPFQAPVMLGPADARRRPFLGSRIDHRGDRTIVAVERVDSDGTVVLQGGWASGLSVGTELSVAGNHASRLRITKILGLGRSVARMESGRPIRSGALLEVVAWAAPPESPLRVWAPLAAGDVQNIAQRFVTATKARWLRDPLDVTPTHVLRPRGSGWELLERDGDSTPLPNESSAVAAIAKLRPTSSLFVQFPAPSTLIDGIAIGQGIVAVDDPTVADFILVGRHQGGGRTEYAWMRPLVRGDDPRDSGLPPQTAWVRDSAVALRADLLTLRRIHAWQRLESPPGSDAPYRLGLLHAETKALVRNEQVIGGDIYSIVLRASQPTQTNDVRYYYVFVIDSHGKSYLAFPSSGSVENRFPIPGSAPAEIRLGEASAFRVMRPYGVDTYFLLSTDEPLPNPSILAWDGVRAPTWTNPLTPLEEVLLLTITGVRAARPLTTSQWSIERVTIESVAPW